MAESFLFKISPFAGDGPCSTSGSLHVSSCYNQSTCCFSRWLEQWLLSQHKLKHGSRGFRARFSSSIPGSPFVSTQQGDIGALVNVLESSSYA